MLLKSLKGESRILHSYVLTREDKAVFFGIIGRGSKSYDGALSATCDTKELLANIENSIKNSKYYEEIRLIVSVGISERLAEDLWKHLNLPILVLDEKKYTVKYYQGIHKRFKELIYKQYIRLGGISTLRFLGKVVNEVYNLMVINK